MSQLCNKVDEYVLLEENGNSDELVEVRPSKLLLALFVQNYGKILFISFVLSIFIYFIGLFLTITLIVFSLVLALYLIQSRLLYHPDAPPESRHIVLNPNDFQNITIRWEEICIQTEDNFSLHTYLLLQDSPHKTSHTSKTVIFFHGNAGNIGHRLVFAFYLYSIGLNVFLVEYRGFGKSQGFPSEKGLTLDAKAAINYLITRSDIDNSNIYLFGRSLGGGVALAAMQLPIAQRYIKGVIVENTYTSIPDVTPHLLPVFKHLPRLAYRNVFDNLSRCKQLPVSFPLLIISGLKDKIVPPIHSQILYDNCSSSLKRIVKFPDGDHNLTWQAENYLETLNEFIQP